MPVFPWNVFTDPGVNVSERGRLVYSVKHPAVLLLSTGIFKKAAIKKAEKRATQKGLVPGLK